MSDSLWPHGLQHARLPCPSSSPGVCSNSVHWFSDAIQPSHPLSLPSLPALNLSQHQNFSKTLTLCIMWLKYCSFISPSNEYSGLISFRIDWFDLFAVPGILVSFLQHHSLKTSILWCWAFFMVQLSHPYMTTGKTTSLTTWTFVGKVMSLLYDTLSRFVISFPPRSKCLLISWLQSLSAVISEPQKIKSVTVPLFTIYLPLSDEAGCYDLSFLNIEI